jgi:cell division protein ZapA (FtsZ GTPase activity inhibitor)
MAMSQSEKILVELAGQEFRIAPPGGSADRLQRAAAIVNRKIAEMEQAGVVATQRTALLAALDLALELLSDRESRPTISEGELSQAKSRLDDVIHKIDDALTESP